MDKYWRNQEGYYDPTLAKVIEKENHALRTQKLALERKRNKEVYKTIKKIKSILESKDLELIERITLRDKRTKKEYR
ncbi:hypothetical protein [Garciella nitratireducens]|uniref:Uncharacterized protein n=1 Tax=Garciella nitratireducens DSM 15102 TaxID=1121911 RepID=A0A1T4K7B4_9FIRM|nr:hypothetical protein [Garciella nitratireducens]SJZ38205.1 hypothetical protein SAMN02745973_00386 [Garciella nitratireducens DSM 15102]